MTARTARPRRPIKTHGTHSGFNAHALRDEDPCARCDTAERIYQRDKKRRTRPIARLRALLTDPRRDFAIVVADGTILPLPATSVVRAVVAGRKVITRVRPAWEVLNMPEAWVQAGLKESA